LHWLLLHHGGSRCSLSHWLLLLHHGLLLLHHLLLLLLHHLLLLLLLHHHLHLLLLLIHWLLLLLHHDWLLLHRWCHEHLLLLLVVISHDGHLLLLHGHLPLHHHHLLVVLVLLLAHFLFHLNGLCMKKRLISFNHCLVRVSNRCVLVLLLDHQSLSRWWWSSWTVLKKLCI